VTLLEGWSPQAITAHTRRNDMTFSTAPVSDVAPDSTTKRDIRVDAFRVTIAIISVFVLTGPGGVADLTAAVSLGADPAVGRLLHRWHHIDVGAYLTLLTVGTLLVAAWRPRRATLAVQTTLVSLAIFAGFITLALPSPGEVLAPLAVVSTLLLVSFPEPHMLRRLPAGRATTRAGLLGAAVITPFLVTSIWDNLSRQLASTDPHAVLGHWAGAAALAAALLVAVWAGTRAGSTARGLRLVAAITLLYLGVAAIVHGAYDGAWPLWGAASALLAGAALAWSTAAVDHEVRS
jgi:hypothetical protein